MYNLQFKFILSQNIHCIETLVVSRPRGSPGKICYVILASSLYCLRQTTEKMEKISRHFPIGALTRLSRSTVQRATHFNALNALFSRRECE